MISALREQVAERMGVPPEELEAPQACCTCIRDRDPRRLAVYDEAQGQGCSIAVEGHTACVEFTVSGAAPPPLQAGEAIIYPLGVPQRPPAGEWNVTLQFRTRAHADADATLLPTVASQHSRVA